MKTIEPYEADFQVLYPRPKRMRGEDIVKWAMDIADDAGEEMPGSVAQAIAYLEDAGLARFAKEDKKNG